ncbi:MAG: hypothetical protein QXG21_04285, partial [Candidatus Caldarchaeum sp.]
LYSRKRLNDASDGKPKYAEIRRKIAEDKFLQELVKKSNLTQKQVETLIFDVISQRDGVRLTSQERAALRGVTKGSFIRTRKQALRNIQKSFITLILLSYLGLIKLPEYNWFYRLSDAFEEKDWEAVREFLVSLEV